MCVRDGLVWCECVCVCSVGEGATLLMLLGTSGGGWWDAACTPGSGVGVLSSPGHQDSSLMELICKSWKVQSKPLWPISPANNAVLTLSNTDHFLHAETSWEASKSKFWSSRGRFHLKKAAVMEDPVSCGISRLLCRLTGRETAQRGNPVVCVWYEKQTEEMQTHG